MKTVNSIIVAAVVLAAGLLNSRAQSNITTVTNVVTVLVTNVVTVTNVVAATPPAPAAPVVDAIPKYPWESSLTAGLTLTRGNSHTLLYSGNFLTDKKTPDNEFSLGADGAYGSQDSKENVNNYGAFGQWNHLFTDRFYGYLRASAMRDIVADVDYRLNVGPGIGYYLVKATNTTLAAEAGAGYQYEHLGDEFNSFITARAAERFEHKFSDHARLWQTAEYLPQVDKLENYFFNFEIGIETTITKSFSLKTYFDYNYASEPADGRYKNDTKLVTGIAYKF
jgi:putative salt-induced outer membrane protein